MNTNDLRASGILLSIEEIPFSETIFMPDVKPHVREGILARAPEILVRRITYRSNGHAVSGYVVEPNIIEGTLPCIILNRGGNRDFGCLTDQFAFSRLGQMASWGYVVIASQYSGGPGSEGSDEFGGADLQDVLVLPEILAMHPHADTSRIGMYGGSRGGMMTYMALTRVDWITTAVIAAGLTDLSRSARLRPPMLRVYEKTFGASAEDIRARSAVCWSEHIPKDVPLMIMHGTADERVSVEDALDMSTALIRNGVHPRVVLFENDDHFFSRYRKEQMRMTREWFDRHLQQTRP